MHHMQLQEEHALSRRRFLRTAAGAAGVLGSGLFVPELAQAGGGVVDPKPIPGGTQLGPIFGAPTDELFHFFRQAPGIASPNIESSTITDFNGLIGVAHIRGSGTATNTKTGAKTRLLYDADLRFMTGEYVGVDGKKHHGTFALV
jgi:hypothetical protein